MADTIYNQQEELLPPQRSTFLTVLCVLTFLGSAYGIFSGLSALVLADKTAFTAKTTIEEQEQAKEKLETKKDEPGAKFAIKMLDSAKQVTPEKIKMSGVAGACASVLTLLGALLMWRLNRKGFYLYVAGILASVAIPFIIFGTDSMIAVIGSLVPGFFGVVFIAMYAFNLKDMR